MLAFFRRIRVRNLQLHHLGNDHAAISEGQ